MLRRSIFELSSRRSLKRIPRQITAQRFISSRKEFSTASQGNARPIPSSMGKPPDSKGNSSRVLLGSAVVAGAFLVAYQTGYMDQYLGKSQQTSVDSDKIGVDGKDTKDVHNLPEQIVSPNIVHPNSEEPDKSSATKEDKVETQTDLPHSEAFNETLSESHHTVEDKSHVEDGRLPSPKPNLEYQESSVASSAQSTDSGTSSERSAEIGNLKSETSAEPTKEVVTNSLATTVSEENQMKSIPSQHVTTEETPEDAADKAIERSTSLLDAYHLREDAGESNMTSLYREQASKETEALLNAIDDLNAGHISKNGKLVLDFLEAIHVAEKRQAELDAHVFSEERRALKERYENELRDLRARELMRIEEAAILDKELKRERTKAAAAIKSIQEKMDEKLRTELEQKEIEAELKLKKVQELAKAELAAAIATEKAAQIEKMAEANLHINALCMAFYARSEEARKSHFVHKVALGALALEDALSKGLPIQKEIDALQTYLEGIEKDSILDLVLSSLPEESRCCGTDTLLQLSQNFNILKGTLRHFSLIPPGGGGILAHFLAHIATWLKVKEVDQSGEGIESIIKRVDGYLAEGKLGEAAAALEEGVRGSQAEEIVGHWVRRARNRAITEQALTLLESYATCISLT